MNNLIAGQLVKVYQDPITCIKPEGTATLVKYEGPNNKSEGDNDPFYYWSVHFLGDDSICYRLININNCAPY